MHALAELLASAGLEHPADLKPHHLARRISSAEIKLFSELLPYLEPGELLGGKSDSHAFYSKSWGLARSESFRA